MSAIRPPVAAGRFYPAAADDLARTVDGLLADASPSPPPGELRALVAPHAGYVYSGAVAGSAFAALTGERGERRVALLGPSHFFSIQVAAVSGADGWRTPLGLVPVDAALRAAATAAGAVVDDRAHDEDHALEVELPFLQRAVGGGLSALFAAVPTDDTEETARLVAALAADALVVVSTDLSHYHDAVTARELDRRTADAVLALDDLAIGDLDACGAGALRGLIRHARRAGWICTLLDLGTSADTGGDAGCVVGYGAFAFTAEPDAAEG